jgi:hypothetical protein
MPSTYCNGLQCLLDLLKAMLHLATMRSMVTNIPKVLPCRWYLVKVVDISEDNPYSSRSCEVSLCYAEENYQKDVERAFGVLHLDFLLSDIPLSLGLRSRCGR